MTEEATLIVSLLIYRNEEDLHYILRPAIAHATYSTQTVRLDTVIKLTLMLPVCTL
jgi:hypothetical protein